MMDWRITFFAYALVISAVLSAAVFLIIWKRRTKPGALPLGLLMLGISEWCVAVAFETTGVTMAEKVFWSQISYVGIVSVTPLFFMFTYEYTSNGRKVSPALLAGLWVIPIFTFIMAATNNLHHLVWSSFEFIPNTNILIYHHGIAFWIHITFLYSLLAICMGTLLWSAIRNRNLYRQQSVTLLIAIPIPLVWNVLYIGGLSPLKGMDLTPVAFSVAGMIVAWGIYRIRMFDIIPVERDTILENLTDGIIILDTGQRVVDMNTAAAGMVNLSTIKALGEDINRLSPVIASQLNPMPVASEWACEVQLNPDPIFYVEIRYKKLMDRVSTGIGFSIILRDITSRKLAEQALQESEKRNQDLMENAALPVVLLSPESFEIVYANQRFNALVDEPGVDFVGKKIETYFDRHGELQRILRMVRKSKLVNDMEAPMSTAIDREVWVLLSANLTQFNNREVLFLSFNDITARKLVEEAERQQRIFSDALRSSVSALNSTLKIDEVLDMILSSLEKVIPHDIANIMLVDETGSARVVRARGYEVGGLEKILSKMNIQVAEMPNLLKMAVSGAPLVIPDTRTESSWVDVDGTDWVRSYIGAPILVKGKVVGYINLDSTKPRSFDRSHADRLQLFADQAALAIENARMFEKVEQMAIVDTLTGLYNRRHFYELAEREVERFRRYHSPLSLILLDLDHFKLVNDNYGHQVGDYVLNELARLFSVTLRKMDIPGRLGGEEFVLLLPETGLDQAVLAAERLRQNIDANDFATEGHHIHVTATMGVVEMGEDISNVQMLISLADKVMYKAKSAGRNKVLAVEDHRAILG